MRKINFSGHPVAGFDLAPFVGANLPLEGGACAEYIREVLLGLPGREDLLAGGAAEIILPGMSFVAGLLLSEWHGQFGNFPRIRWSVRGAGGFEWPDTATADLQEIRTAARTAR